MYRRNLFVGIVGVGLSKLASVKTSATCEYDAKAMGKLNHKTILGSEFKKQFPKYKPMKVIGYNRRGFQYRIGLNTNYEPFNPSGTCEGGGLYFTDETDIFRYCEAYGHKIAMINLPDNEPIYIDGNKCKVNSFEITEILEIRDWMQKLTIDEKLSAINQNPDLIKYVDNSEIRDWMQKLTIDEKLSAIKKNPYLIKYVDNSEIRDWMQKLTIDEKLSAIKKNPFVIQYIDNPYVSVQMEAIKCDPFLIRYIANPDVSVQMEAIKYGTFLIRYIANPDVSVQIEAIKHDHPIIECPYIYVRMLALKLKLRIKNYFV